MNKSIHRFSLPVVLPGLNPFVGSVPGMLLVLCLWLVPAELPANAASGGAVVAWGPNGSGQTAVPAGLSGVTAIAAGEYHFVALKSDGTVVAWGANGDGQANVPAGLSGVTAIAAGYAHTVALKSDGTVVAWGNNNSGQTNVPGGLSGVTAIAAGGDLYSLDPSNSNFASFPIGHTVALKSNGTVVAWGDNRNGQSAVRAGLSGVTAIAAGALHSVALKTNGTVEAWGAGTITRGIFAGFFPEFGQSNVPDGLSGVTAIAAGGFHSVALKSDGTVVAWGDNRSGQTTVPTGLSGVTAIAAGGFHSVALKSDGTVVAWGANGDGRADVPVGFSGMTAIAAGGSHTVALGRFPSAGVVSPDKVLRRASFSLTADAKGDGPLFYQWQRAGVNLPGATNANLTVSAGEPGSGTVTYSVKISNAYGFSVASAFINVVNANRRLPSGFWPQVPFVVEINYVVGQGVLTHAIVENPPGSITGINEGGSWDSSTRTVKWGPFFDDTPRVLRYTITPSAGDYTGLSFSGILSENGVSSPLPSQTLTIYPLHPADNALPANNFIRILEMSTYAAAWKRGLRWPVGSNPINVDYVTQAGVIWRRGEYYEYIGGAKPQCWQPATPPAGVVPQSLEPGMPQKSGGSARLLAKSIQPLGMSTAGTAVRTMSSVVNPAARFDVILTITPAASTTAQLVEEQLPSGWQATNITAGGSVDTNFNKVKWGPFFDATTRTLTYTVVPPAGINGTFTLSGLAAFDGDLITISGQSILGTEVVGSTGDFDGDSQPDLIFRDNGGALAAWLMNGDNIKSSTFLTPANVGDTNWRVADSADFNGDGMEDLLFQHADGTLAVWSMNGVILTAANLLNPSRPSEPNWRVTATDDFNSDGEADLVFQHSDGTLAVWFLSGASLTSAALFNPSNPGDVNWRVAGVGDFDLDGNPDLLFQHEDGALAVWFLNGVSLTGASLLSPSNPGAVWRVASVVDRNADGKPDLLFQHDKGTLAVWFMNGVELNSAQLLNPSDPGGTWKAVAPR